MDAQGELKSAQAHEVIGTLAAAANLLGNPEVLRALDYFADARKVDEDFLPFTPE